MWIKSNKLSLIWFPKVLGRLKAFLWPRTYLAGSSDFIFSLDNPEFSVISELNPKFTIVSGSNPDLSNTSGVDLIITALQSDVSSDSESWNFFFLNKELNNLN